MAGIGFQLAKMARDGGIGGIVGAALHGTAISAGPWLVTAASVVVLAQWSRFGMTVADAALVRSILIYAFSLTAVIAAPIGILTTRLASDALFAGESARIPGIVGPALMLGGTIAAVVAAVLFGWVAPLPFDTALLTTLLFAILTQIWITAPLITAAQRYGMVLTAYLAGIAVIAAAIALLPGPDASQVLGAIVAGLAVTLVMLAIVLVRRFPAPARLPSQSLISRRQGMLVALAGLLSVMAIWIDKWMLWFGPQSVQTIATLRLNPINDFGSFLGLLTLVPGLTLMLIVTETRFDRAFSDLMARCTGTSRLGRIEEARADVIATMFDGLRVLLISQLIVAASAWVLAVPLIDLIGADIRVIFAFRQTALGAVFHLIAIASTVVLAYFNLFGRIVAVWGAFTLTSAIATVWLWQVGVGAFGWGYLAGAVMAAAIGVAMVANATVNLIFMLFVGNNPAVVGSGGRLL
ncbi:exopolysaccharide Pel transporter PelG [uncultured Sphingomonas sp.]|uniref:exopolysaccharide Pel transporter PelG n=1 Tax=uncultured Sphingomonas sp. TaxID=158754 RepID=UPI0025EE167F|nr:exopolysaccharide Pel transporter PelG [uncultured Sphingomonas sp.]